MAKKQQSAEHIRNDLRIDEDIELQEKGWHLQRIGYVFIFLIVGTAALGLFGDGVLSKKNDKQASSSIEYQQFYRHEAKMPLKIDINNFGRDSAVISFPNNYMERFKVESILPEPKSNSVSGDHQNYIFNGNDHMKIIFHLVPQKTGSVNSRIIINGESYSLHHFIYP